MTTEVSGPEPAALEAMRADYARVAEKPPARLIDGLVLLAGLGTAISPWAAGFSRYGDVSMTNLISGLAVALVAAGLSAAYSRAHTIAWVVPVVGAWIIVTPFAVQQTDAMTPIVINNAIAGGVVCFLGLGSFALEVLAPRHPVG
ncbi:SPW repeat protein [Amycolatopsis tolypomycina]|uniref:SPW repeat protein n=1 Tax=Amycolatopsis tolypomycina TaxID=208445 RepID=UPI0033B53E28